MPNTYSIGPRKGIRDSVSASRTKRQREVQENYVSRYNAAVDKAADKNKWGDGVRAGHKLGIMRPKQFKMKRK